MRLNLEHGIIQSLQEHYMAEHPAPASVIVYKDSIKPVESLGDDDKVEGWYQATVKLTTNYVSTKTHKVHIKFKINKRNRVIPETIDFLF